MLDRPATNRLTAGATPGGLKGAHSQTIVELYAQLQTQGQGAEDLQLVHRAYGLAVELCTCQYRSSGRTQIDHCVGTASILAATRNDSSLVAAGIVHVGYMHGDFGTMLRRIDERKRRRMRERVGDVVEEYVYRYSQLEWDARSLPVLLERLPELGTIDRDVVLMRLADELDIYGRTDALYTNNVDSRRSFARDNADVHAALAHRLGQADLAAALSRGFAQMERTLPRDLSLPPWSDDFVVPPSFRRRGTIVLYQGLRSQLYAWIGR